MAGLLVSLLALSAPLALVTEAALDGCRSDPIMYLTDGTALDLSASIGTSVANVTSIAYVVHVPAGPKLLLYVATPTLGFRGKESFTLVNDAPAGQYRTDTYVTTSIRGVSVTSYTTLVGVYLTNLSLSLQSKPATGLSSQHIWTTVYR